MQNIKLRNFKEKYTWDQKAAVNPLYAVMAVDKFINKNSYMKDWKREDLKILFRKGQKIYHYFLKPILMRSGLNYRKSFIVEYGCGIGRILKWVKKDGYNCASIDISEKMLHYCKMLVRDIDQLYLLKNGVTKLPDNIADVVYSCAVLQHIPKLSQIESTFHEMCRILKPGGILRTQFYSFDWNDSGSVEGKRLFTHNFENSTLQIILQPKINGDNKSWIPGHTLNKIVYKHNYWVGIPLTIYKIKQLMKNNKMKIIGIDRDLGQRNFGWLTAAKFDYIYSDTVRKPSWFTHLKTLKNLDSCFSQINSF